MGEIARRLLTVSVLFAVLAVILLLGTIPAGPTSPLARIEPSGAFPAVQGTTLNGERIALPDGFAGERNLVALGFSAADREAVTSWENVGLRRYSVAFYAVPTLGAGGLVSRFLIDNALRFAVTGEDARERTIALHLDRAAFRRVLGLSEDAGAVVLLLDGEGNELWRAEGPATDEAVNALDAALAEAS